MTMLYGGDRLVGWGVRGRLVSGGDESGKGEIDVGWEVDVRSASPPGSASP